ncbi:MAG: DUF1656 domain-containing protein [Verrucomicrobium sp.]|nr:DUF1656 domain-containing protein [Verrucomicrobium sp.]
MKEIDFFGVYLPPFFGFLVLALLAFLPISVFLDGSRLETWAWHPALFKLATFLLLLSLVGLVIGML